MLRLSVIALLVDIQHSEPEMALPVAAFIWHTQLQSTLNLRALEDICQDYTSLFSQIIGATVLYTKTQSIQTTQEENSLYALTEMVTIKERITS